MEGSVTMDAPKDEVEVDFDAIDRLKAEEAGKSQKSAEKEPPEPIETAEEAPEAENTTLSPAEGLSKLKKQLDDERARADSEAAGRQEAERRERESAEREAAARAETQTTQLDLVKNAIERVTQENDALEGKYAEALQAQDFAAAAKINRQMTTNAASLQTLEQGKSQLEKAPKPTVRAPPDIVEEFCSRLSPTSAAWVRKHPDFVRDGAKNRQMLAAHALAIARGHPGDSEAYFRDVESSLGLVQPRAKTNGATPHIEEEDPTAEAAQEVEVKPDPPARRAAPPAAPVTRSGGGGGAKPNRMKLTAAQVEAAEISGQSLEEYAQNLQALKQEGKIH